MNFIFNLSLEVKSIFGAKGLGQSQIKRVQAKNRGDVQVKDKFRAHLMWKTLTKGGRHHIKGALAKCGGISSNWWALLSKGGAILWLGACINRGRHQIRGRHPNLEDVIPK